MVLSVAYEGIAIPLYYELLDHKGNSDSQIRIKLMQKFISNFGKNHIGCLLGDREFIGSHWLSWLDNQQISYAIRVRNNLLATASNGGETQVSNFEDTHLTDKNKIAKLMALLPIAFVWAHKVGEYRDAKIQKITRKKHGRPQNSYFRYGLDMIVNAIQKIGFYSNDFSLCLKIFNKTTKELKI